VPAALFAPTWSTPSAGALAPSRRPVAVTVGERALSVVPLLGSALLLALGRCATWCVNSRARQLPANLDASPAAWPSLPRPAPRRKTRSVRPLFDRLSVAFGGRVVPSPNLCAVAVERFFFGQSDETLPGQDSAGRAGPPWSQNQINALWPKVPPHSCGSKTCAVPAAFPAMGSRGPTASLLSPPRSPTRNHVPLFKTVVA